MSVQCAAVRREVEGRAVVVCTFCGGVNAVMCGGRDDKAVLWCACSAVVFTLGCAEGGRCCTGVGGEGRVALYRGRENDG